MRGQPSLWPYGISGDRPILLVRVDDPSATELVQELLLAHEYWRLNTLSVDLVILNEDPGGYLQPLQDLLLGMVRSSPAQGHLDQPGGVFVRRADQIPEEDRILLLAVARVVLLTSRGRLARQLARVATDATPSLHAVAVAGQPTERGNRTPVPRTISSPGADRAAVLQWPGRVHAGWPRVRDRSGPRQDDAGAVDQRHRERRLRLPRLGERVGVHLAGQQPGESDHPVVERSDLGSVGRGALPAR